MTEPTLVNALLRIPTNRLIAGPNARGNVGDVTDLAQSIRALGLQKPLLVHDLGDGRYQVLDGHRRLAAARLLKLPHVDAVLRRAGDPALRLEQQLAMHTHARAFDPIAEAKALHTLMWEHNKTREQIAAALGKSPAWVRDRIALLQLPAGDQQAVAAGRLPVGQALLMVKAARGARDGKPITPLVLTPRTGKHCTTCRCGGRR